MNSRPKVCQLNEWITREEDVEDHGQGDYARKDGDEEPDTLDEKYHIDLAEICKIAASACKQRSVHSGLLSCW
jgi:hypothetical protein